MADNNDQIYSHVVNPQLLYAGADQGLSRPPTYPPLALPEFLSIEPTMLPVPIAVSIDTHVLDNLARGAKRFFRTMMAPTVKHI